MTREQLLSMVYLRLGITLPDDNINRLTLEQLEFVVHDLDRCCDLEACPGSGKTEVVGIKAAYELIEWKSRFKGLAIMSFTNNASNEIGKRARKYAGLTATSHPHFIGTIDSFFYKYVLCPFFHGYVRFCGKDGDRSPRMVADSETDAKFLLNPNFNPKTKYAVQNPNRKPGAPAFVGLAISANRFFFDLERATFQILPPFDKANNKHITFDEFWNRAEQQIYIEPLHWLTKEKAFAEFWTAKKAFWSKGFVTFRDSELLVFRIVENCSNIRENLVKRFPYLLIDECQDLSPMQLKTLELLLKAGSKLTLVGDLNQSIYAFREVNPERTGQFIEKHNLRKLYLSHNFRSNQMVVNVFERIFQSNIIGHEKERLKSSLILIEYEENEIPQLTNRYLELIAAANHEAKEELIRLPHSSIIIRGKTLLNRFRPFDAESKNPITILATSLQLWNSEVKNTEVMSSAISLFGRFLSICFYENEGSHRNQYCLNSVSIIKWRMAIASLLNYLSGKIYPFQDKKSNKLSFTKWAAIARQTLPYLVSNLPFPSMVKLEDVSMSAERGLGPEIVETHVAKFKIASKVKMSTIHNVKGETFDSVMVVSSLDRRSKGGHWEDWFSNTASTSDELEHKRYGYVAFSRPKHLLVLATPKLKPSDKHLFSSLGFQIENLKTATAIFSDLE